MRYTARPLRVALIGWVTAAFAFTVLSLPLMVNAEDQPSVRLAVLNFGTVNWELDVIAEHGLDVANGVTLDVVRLANKNATSIALNAGDVDMIVNDWIWVSRQRDAGFDFTFVPYSEAAGSVMVHPDSGINSLMDLDDKIMGIAGSPLDKSWLLLRAYTLKTFGKDLGELVEPAYAAPPLLNEKFRQQEFDSVLNYWNYTARLRARNMKELIKVQDLLPALGVEGRLALIGYVFGEQWAADNPRALAGFLAASAAARQIMLESDDEWTRLMPLTGAKDEATLIAFRDGFREGIPKALGPEQAQAIATAFGIVAELGGRALVGKSTQLAPGTVWAGQQ
jgi:NitT/TauT family transport system substrate-binding protein